MSIFKKIKDTIKEVGLTNELCEHLRKNGVEATVLDTKSPDAVKHSRTLGVFGNPPLGCVKVEGRNIDLIEVYRFITGGDDELGVPGNIVYKYDCVVKANVGDLEDALKAKIKRIEKGLIRKKLVDFEWRGNRLAKLLNADSDLKKMLFEVGVPPLAVRPNKKDKYVAITMIQKWSTISIDGVPIKYKMVIGKEFPTREAFEIYDRIAQHVRSIATVRP